MQQTLTEFGVGAAHRARGLRGRSVRVGMTLNGGPDPVFGWIERFDVLLALKRDGEYMPVRDKGPLFVACPSDSSPGPRAKAFHGRSVWHLAQFAVG